MSRRPPQRETIEDASPLSVYRQALGLADKDSVHDAIVRAGPEILNRGLPYVVTAARWQYASSRRKELRRKCLEESINVTEAPSRSLWDPYERVAHRQVLRIVADALATLPDEDVLVIWEHLLGRSDEEIRAKLNLLGIGRKNPTVVLIRKRRQRALERLKLIIGSRLHDRP